MEEGGVELSQVVEKISREAIVQCAVMRAGRLLGEHIDMQR